MSSFAPPASTWWNGRATARCLPGSIVPATRRRRHSHNGNSVAARRNRQARNPGQAVRREVGDSFPVAAALRIECLEDAPLPREHDPIRRPRVVFHATRHANETFLLPRLWIEQRQPPLLVADLVDEAHLPVMCRVQ